MAGSALQRRVDPGYPPAPGADAGSQHPQPVHRTGCGAACRRTLRGAAGLPLLHQLLLSACQLPLLYHEDGHDGALIELVLHELKPPLRCRCLPPAAERAAGCAVQRFSRQPDIHSTPEQWAVRLNKSARTFHRLFRQQTGMAFRDWRQQACLMYALTALREGRTITDVRSAWDMNTRRPLPACFDKRLQAPTAFGPPDDGGPV